MTKNIPVHVLEFAKDGNKNLYTLFADLFAERRYNGGEKGVTFVKYDNEGRPTNFDSKEAAVNKLFMEEVRRVSGLPNLSEFNLMTYANNPNLKWATFAIVGALIDSVVPHAIVDSMGLYTEVKNIAWGDSAAWDVEPTDLFSVSKAGRAKTQAWVRKQYKGQVVLNPENHQISVGVALYRVLAGQDSLADFVMKAAQSIQVGMTRDAYSSFATAMDALPASLTETGWSAAGFITLAQTVSAWNNSPAIAVCTSLAAQQILPDDANYRYDLESDFASGVSIRNFKGYDVMILPQIAKYETEFDLVLDDTKIWLLSPARGKMVKLVIEGNTIANTSDFMENADLQSVATLSSSWVTGIATNARAGIIELS